MTRYDEPDEDFIPDPDDGQKSGGAAINKKRSNPHTVELKTVYGISEATCQEFDAELFGREYEGILESISIEHRTRVFAEGHGFLIGSYGQGRRVAPVLLHMDGVEGDVSQERQQRIEWLAAYLKIVAEMDVHIMDLWTVVDSVATGGIEDKHDLVDLIVNKNCAVIFNDMYIHDQESPWSGDVILQSKVHSLFRALYAKGGNFFMVVDTPFNGVPGFDELLTWWGHAMASSMIYDSVVVKL
jgi:hypothetical protein